MQERQLAVLVMLQLQPSPRQSTRNFCLDMLSLHTVCGTKLALHIGNGLLPELAMLICISMLYKVPLVVTGVKLYTCYC